MSRNAYNPKFLFIFMVVVLVLSLMFPSAAFADEAAPPVEETSETETPPEGEESEPIVVEEGMDDVLPVPVEESEIADAPETAEAPFDDSASGVDEAQASVVEIVSDMNEAGVILADDAGNPIPLAAEVAQDALLNPDPIGCPPGVQPVSWGGTGTGCTTSYGSIQAAIDDVNVAAGWTIYIDPGEFYENVNVNKSVTLQGSGVGVTIVHPGASSTPSLGCGAGSCASTSNTVFYITADNVTIRDLTIDGDNPLVNSGTVVNGADINARNGIYGNDADNLVVEDTEVKNVYLRGIQSSYGDSIEIRNNVIENVDGSIYSIAIFNFGGGGVIEGNTINEVGDGIASNWSNGTQVLNNTISNMGTGIHTDNTQAPDVISGNTIMDGTSNSYGIFVFAPYEQVIVSGNTITNVDVGLTVSGNGWNSDLDTMIFDDNYVESNMIGAYVTTDVWGYFFSDVSASFTNNIFSGGDYGFYLESNGAGEYYPDYDCSGAGGDCVLTVTGSGNSITGQNLFAATIASGTLNWFDNTPSYYGEYNVDLSGNWWGDASGPNDSTAVPDGCGILLDNPSGLGGEVSDCILYDLWLAENPFAVPVEAEEGEDSEIVKFPLLEGVPAFAGGPFNGRGVLVSCSTEETNLAVGAVQVRLLGLCGYEVVLQMLYAETIQPTLSGGTFRHGLRIDLFKDGVPVNSLPSDASIIISYPEADGVPMKWSNGWFELSGKKVGTHLEVFAGPGVYILIKR